MSEQTEDLEFVLAIEVEMHGFKHMATCEGIAACGYGYTKLEAKYDLLCKILLSDTLRPLLYKAINPPREEAHINFSYEFSDNFCTVIATDEEGRERSTSIKIIRRGDDEKP